MSFADRKRWFVLAVAVVAQFMVILDVAVVNVALPEIKSDLGFSQESLQWVITAYAILFGGTLLLGGRLADLFGRRLLFQTGTAIFTVGSLLSGIAWSETSLIVARAIQGLGGALLSPAALSVIVTAFPEGRERNRALGIWAAAAAAGGSAGVSPRRLAHELRGVAVDLLRQPPGRRGRPARGGVRDRREPASSHPASRSRRRGLGHGRADAVRLRPHLRRRARLGERRHDRAPRGRSRALATFVVVEWRSRAPLLPLRLFRLPMLAAANATMVTVGTLAFGSFFLVTLYLQDVLGYSPLRPGWRSSRSRSRSECSRTSARR